MKQQKNTWVLATTIAWAFVSANAAEITSTAAEQNNLHVTIYNSNLALIKDSRDIQLTKGQNTLAFKDVSAQIKPETVILKANGVNLLEQNFEYDLLSPQTLLEKYVGKTVRIATTNPSTGEVSESSATVLSNNGAAILKIGNNIRPLDSNMSIIYDNVPENLRDKPTMTMLIDSQSASKQPIELTYLSDGLNWKADYVVNLLDDKNLNLKGWVTLNNTSGTDYNDAQLQLVAGDVNRVQPPGPKMAVRAARMEMLNTVATNMAEESLFEYHLYSLGRTTTIKDKQQKQVSLLSATSVPYEKRLEIYATDNYGWRAWGKQAEYIDLATQAKLMIENKQSSQLGLPMPAGVMRTYQKDSQGNAQFIGEDRIQHTSENESIILQLGESFDVTAKRKQTAFDQQRSAQQNAVKTIHKNVLTASYEVVFKNAKAHDVVVNYFETFSGNWSLTAQSLKSEQLNSSLNRWYVNIPAKGETVLTYTVKIVY